MTRRKRIPAEKKRFTPADSLDESPRHERQAPLWLILLGLVAVGKLVYEAWRWTRWVQ